jgi:tetratricopeptide (TPR) repeat protein
LPISIPIPIPIPISAATERSSVVKLDKNIGIRYTYTLMATENQHRTASLHSGQLCLVALAVLFMGLGCSTKGNDKFGPRSDPMNRIDDLWDFHDPAASEQRFRAFMETSQDPLFRSEILTQVARAQGLQNEFDEAQATLDEAEAMMPDDASEVRIRLLLERGRVLNSAGKPAESRPFFLDALAFAEQSKQDYYAIDAAHMLGIVDPPAEQIAWSERALEIARSSKDPRARNWLGPVYNNLGWSYHDAGQFDRALAHFERALDWYREHGDAEQVRVARWSVGRALRSLGRVDEALSLQETLLKDLDAAGVTDGFVYEELAECLLALERDDEARKYFALAYRELSQDTSLAQAEPARIERLKSLSEGAAEQRRP